MLMRAVGADDQVIVIDMDSEDETRILLESFELLYPNLQHTFTPHSAHHVDLRRLAVTLGMRAARHTDLVIGDITMLLPLPEPRPADTPIRILRDGRPCYRYILLRPLARWLLRRLARRICSRRMGARARRYVILTLHTP